MVRKSGVFLCGFLVLCMLAGCGRGSNEKPISPTEMPTPDSSVSTTPTVTDPVHSLTVVPSQTAEMPIYTINGDMTELTELTALIDAGEEITAQTVTDAVVDALADSAIYVTVNSVTQSDTVIIVDFAASAPPVSTVGAGIEGMILDAFGQSLLDNLPDCSGVSFTADGGAYVSGHFEFGKGEIYMRR